MAMKYNKNKAPYICMQTQSTCYKGTYVMDVKGILWHSTGAANPLISRYVQPSDPADSRDTINKTLLGDNPNDNDWNHIYHAAGLNAWIGELADGTVATVQTMPWKYAPWGCGADYIPFEKCCNNGWIQFEICEPRAGADGITPDYSAYKAYARDVFEEACQLTAYLCHMFDLEPDKEVDFAGKKVPVILCHDDAGNLGVGGRHGDINHWFPVYIGKTMEDARARVKEILKEATLANKPIVDNPGDPPKPTPNTSAPPTNNSTYVSEPPVAPMFPQAPSANNESTIKTAGGDTIHSGIYKENYRVSPHFQVSEFCANGSNRYKYSESTVTKLEALFSTFSNIKSGIITSPYRINSGGDMHEKGGAVDISFRDSNGIAFDHRYIAYAAEKVGFSGIAPLIVGTGSTASSATIHLDTRKEYAQDNYKNNLKWFGWEFPDPTRPSGWFDSKSIYASTFLNFSSSSIPIPCYTEQDVIDYLGTPNGSIPTMPPSYESPDSNNQVKYLEIDGPVGTTTSTLAQGETVTDEDVSADSSGNTVNVIKKITLSSKSNKNLYTDTFLVTTDISSAVWAQYWTNQGYDCGYRITLFSNGRPISSKDVASAKTLRSFEFDLSTQIKKGVINHGDNLQVSISEWIRQDKNSSLTFGDGSATGDLGRCSNSIHLLETADKRYSVFIKKTSLNIVTGFVDGNGDYEIGEAVTGPRLTVDNSVINNPLWISSLRGFKGLNYNNAIINMGGTIPKEYAAELQETGTTLPNCTSWAWGRAYEIMGKAPRYFRGDAGNWWFDNMNASNGYSYGSEPRFGAIACWYDPDNYNKNLKMYCMGHVAIVEAVHENGTVTISESGWNTYTWYPYRIYSHCNPKGYRVSNSTPYTFKGYIYLPIDTGDNNSSEKEAKIEDSSSATTVEISGGTNEILVEDTSYIKVQLISTKDKALTVFRK